ncbi:hypothetical protein J4231_00685 [Candidatus Woesearchaeota archaeon]|nr:hypothetical protein [Candidatus Woesearchaeota archaeon]
MAGPAKGINVDLTTDKTIYNKGDSIIFDALVDIQDPERIPATELRLIINNNVTCTFSLNGNIISGCNDMSIQVISNNANFGYGYNSGSGFGLDNNSVLSNKTTFFGYGYGYGYADMVPGELSYKITWDSSNAAIGDYEAKFSIFATNDNSFEYLTEDSSEFTINELKLNNIKETAYAEGSSLILINGTDEFSKISRATFNTDLRHRDIDTSPDLGGYGTLNIDSYKNDSTHIILQVSFEPKSIISFNPNKTEMTGDAKIRYQKTKRGIRINNEWVGAEPTVRFNGIVNNAKLKIQNGEIEVLSDDPLFTFISAGMPIKELEYTEYTYEFSLKNGKIIRKTNISRFRIP